MRVLLQRVNHAKCIVQGKVVSESKKGYLLLVGFTHTDTIENVKKAAKKVANLRVFEDENGKMNLDLKAVFGTILCISQFTLYADVQKGNRPSFTEAMNPTDANNLYLQFCNILRNEYQLEVEEGIFGAHMVLDFQNDGPVTISIEV